MKSSKSLLNLTFSSIVLSTLCGNSGFIFAQSVQAEPLKLLTAKPVLIADTRAVPLALIGEYVGSLKPIAGGCGAAAPITIIIADNGSVSATTTQPYGPGGISAQLSTSINPPLIAGTYDANGYQGFWQGQIIGKDITGGAGISTCRFVFSGVKKVP